ncbi:MAG: DUF4412 domain-containing protein [Acidobacteriota bacterium]
MKRLLIAIACLLPAAAALAQFEGVAEFQSTIKRDGGDTVMGTSKMFFTKTAYRVESEMNFSAMTTARKTARAMPPLSYKMTMVSKTSNPDQLYLVDDKTQTYSIMDLKKMREWAADMKAKDRAESYKVEKQGTDTVAGLPCQKALLTSSKGTQIEVCMSKDIAASSQWIAAMNRRQHDALSWMTTLKDNGIAGFPVRWSVYNRESRTGVMTTELTRLEKKSLPASLFEIPADYKQHDLTSGGMAETLGKMSPEQRRRYEEVLKRRAQTPRP